MLPQPLQSVSSALSLDEERVRPSLRSVFQPFHRPGPPRTTNTTSSFTQTHATHSLNNNNNNNSSVTSPVVMEPSGDYHHFFSVDAAPPATTAPLFRVDEAPQVALSSMLELTPMIITWVPKGIPVEEMLLHQLNPVDGIAIVDRHDPQYFGENSLVELIAPTQPTPPTSSVQRARRASTATTAAGRRDSDFAEAGLSGCSMLAEGDGHGSSAHAASPPLHTRTTPPTATAIGAAALSPQPAMMNVLLPSLTSPNTAASMANHHITNTRGQRHRRSSFPSVMSSNTINIHNNNNDNNVDECRWRPCGLQQTRRALKRGGCIIFTDDFVEAHPETCVAAITQACQAHPRLAPTPSLAIQTVAPRVNDDDDDVDGVMHVPALDCIRDVEAQRRPLFRRIPSFAKYGRGVYLTRREEDRFGLQHGDSARRCVSSK